MAVIEINALAALVRRESGLYAKALLLAGRVWNFSVGLMLVMTVGIATASDIVPVPAQEAGGKARQAKDLSVAGAKQRVVLTVRVLKGKISEDEVAASAGLKSPFPGGKYSYSNASIDSGILHYPPQPPAGVYEFRCLFNEKQFALAWSAMEREKEFKRASLPNMTVQSGAEAVFDLPATLGGKQLRVTPMIAPADGRVIEITILSPSRNPGKLPSYTSAVSIWNGQTLMLSLKTAGKADVSSFIFISARIIEANGEQMKP